ncbi:unnamed protein product [Thlaspi arvense]|uniref:IBB domain-containing protein n=1 Tax=Thlaspi arvense TaxID=13288 RepID=A0AAU9STD9_THLAR|nr:unnamed protein product [Thlaspi arvense]
MKKKRPRGMHVIGVVIYMLRRRRRRKPLNNGFWRRVVESFRQLKNDSITVPPSSNIMILPSSSPVKEEAPVSSDDQLSEMVENQAYTERYKLSQRDDYELKTRDVKIQKFKKGKWHGNFVGQIWINTPLLIIYSHQLQNPKYFLYSSSSREQNSSIETLPMSLRPSAKTEVRRNRYKVSVDAEEGRRRREDHMVEIRKNKREENLQKKRREGISASPAFGSDSAETGHDLSSTNNLMKSLPDMVAGIWSEDSKSQVEATNLLRKLLSIEQNPPINVVVESGVVPRVVKFLSRDDLPKLQFEAAWALTNIASGTSENTNVIIESGAVPMFIHLLSSASEDVREQAVWALGNVAGDSPSCRNLVLDYDAMMPLLSQFNENTKLSMLRNATWTLSNFCRGKPPPLFEKMKPALPVLERLVQTTDEEVLTDACWSLSYLSDDSNDKIQAVIDAGVLPRLVELLAHPSPPVLIPALRTIGNIVTGDDLQTQMVLDHQVLPRLLNLLTKSYKKSIKKEACWTISNITAGSKNQIQAVIEAGLIQSLVWLLHSAEFEVKKEAAWGISNATSGGTHDQIKFMVSQGCIKPLCDLLTCPDPRIVSVCLESLENILVVGEAEKNLGHTEDGNNLYASMIDEAEGVEKIENLQSHDNNDIYQKAVKILQTFWTEDDGEEEGNDENHAPQSGFQFGSTQVPPRQTISKGANVK